MKYTERGFAIYTEFLDNHGVEVRIQQSSSVDRRCWILASKDGKDAHIHCGEPQAFSPHLTPPQARRVAKALLRFADYKPKPQAPRSERGE